MTTRTTTTAEDGTTYIVTTTTLDDGTEVRVRPGGWIRVTLPDGRAREVGEHYDSMGNCSVSFLDDDPEAGRPFAEAVKKALGGQIIHDAGADRKVWKQWLTVLLSAPPLPPIPLGESDPWDEDDE